MKKPLLLLASGCLFLLAAIPSAFSQDAPAESASPDALSNLLGLQIESIYTSAEKWAVGVGAKYAKNFSEKEFFGTGKAGFYSFAPILSVKSGGEDAFDGILAGLNGFYSHSAYSLALTEEEGHQVRRHLRDDFQGGWVHVHPLAVGVETNRDFSNTNVLAELGYVPWWYPATGAKGNPFRLGPGIQMGLFAQVGYKINDASNVGTGGNIDQSAEQNGELLLRLKYSLSTVPLHVRFLDFSAFGKNFQSLVQPEAMVWYDLANSKVYYSAGASFLMKMDDKKAFNFSYSKGSGAPNFNQGDQFSAGMRINF